MKRICLLLVNLAVCSVVVWSGAQPQPDLIVQNLSVASTLAGINGERRLTVSFIVTNAGARDADQSTTRVTIGGVGGDFAVPPLPMNASAFVSRTILTVQTQVTVIVVADFFNAIAEANDQNNQVTTTAQLQFDPARWVSIGPSNLSNFRPPGIGRVTAIAVHPTRNFDAYVGARGSGLWKTDSTQRWWPVGDSLPSAQIDAIAVDPRDGEHVLVATAAGIFESHDGGSVWTLLTDSIQNAFGSDGGAFLIARSSGAMYLTTQDGLKLSTDGGKTWNVVLGSKDAPVTSLQFSTADDTVLYAARSGESPGIFEGTGGGLTDGLWRQLLGCAGGVPAMPTGARVWLSESQGNKYLSWRVEKKVAGVDKAELWRTGNTSCSFGGLIENSWEKVSVSDGCGDFTNTWSYLFAHPTSPEIVFKSGVDLCRSTNRGSQMKKVENIHVDHHAIAIAPSAPAVIYFGCDGGVYRSTDSGASVRFISPGLANTEFFDIDTGGVLPNVVVAGSQDNGTSTWDGTSSMWKYVGGGDSMAAEFGLNDPTQLYEMGQSTKQVQRLLPNSTSLGNGPLPNVKAYRESSPYGLNSAVAIGGNRLAIAAHGVWRGPPWTQIAAPTTPCTADCDEDQPGDFTKLKVGPTGIMVAVTNSGRVLYGLPQQPPLTQVFQTDVPFRAKAITFEGPGTFYIAFEGSGSRMINRIECFTGCVSNVVCSDAEPQIACPVMGAEITALLFDSSARGGLLVGFANRGVFRGVPGTVTPAWKWTSFNNGLPFGVSVTDLERQSDGSIVAATYGRGAYLLAAPTPPTLTMVTVKGRISDFESQRLRPDQTKGAKNSILTTVSLDTKPDWVFSTDKLTVTDALRFASRTRRVIILTYQVTGPKTGKIVRVTTARNTYRRARGS